MSESKLHRQFSSAPLDKGVGAAFGEPVAAAEVASPNTAIRKGRGNPRPDQRFMTHEGVLVAVEFRNWQHTPVERIDFYRRERIPLLEIDIRGFTEIPSDAEIQQFIAAECRLPIDRGKRFLYMPSMVDIIEKQGGDVSGGGDDNFGELHCLMPGCRRPVATAHTNGFRDPQEPLSTRGGQAVPYDVLLGDGRLFAHTLPRFACAEHLMLPPIMTMPGGFDWQRHPATPNTRRISQALTIRDIGNMRVKFQAEPEILGPAA